MSPSSPTRPIQGHGLALMSGAHTARLKWHRLRRSMADPVFSAEVMRDGFRLGASMELDLRVRADGGFVVLHDAVLGRETDGVGVVAALTRTGLAAVRFRDAPRGMVFSEDLAAQLGAAHPEALLQFDMKDDLATIGTRGMDHLAAQFGGARVPVIVSGACLDLILAVGQRLPGVKRGIDPTDKLVEIAKASGWAAVEADVLADLRGPTDPDTVYLEWRLLLQAKAGGLDMVALCQAEGRKVDAWTFTPKGIATGLNDTSCADLAALMALRPDQITTDEPLALEREWVARQGN